MVLSLVQLACSGYNIIQLDFPHLSLSLGTIQKPSIGVITLSCIHYIVYFFFIINNFITHTHISVFFYMTNLTFIK